MRGHFIIKSDRSRVPVPAGFNEENTGIKRIEFPETIVRTKRSPSSLGLMWLHSFLSRYNIKRVLEFSGGVTTWTAYDAIRPDKYVVVEESRFQHIFGPVTDIFPDVEIVNNWSDIPKDSYDLVFIDGSPGHPAELKESNRKTVFRKEALEYSEQFHSKDTIIVFHDWGNGKGGWHEIKKYVQNSPKYEFIEAIQVGKLGFGAFRRVLDVS